MTWWLLERFLNIRDPARTMHQCPSCQDPTGWLLQMFGLNPFTVLGSYTVIFPLDNLLRVLWGWYEGLQAQGIFRAERCSCITLLLQLLCPQLRVSWGWKSLPSTDLQHLKLAIRFKTTRRHTGKGWEHPCDSIHLLVFMEGWNNYWRNCWKRPSATAYKNKQKPISYKSLPRSW